MKQPLPLSVPRPVPSRGKGRTHSSCRHLVILVLQMIHTAAAPGSTVPTESLQVLGCLRIRLWLGCHLLSVQSLPVCKALWGHCRQTLTAQLPCFTDAQMCCTSGSPEAKPFPQSSLCRAERRAAQCAEPEVTAVCRRALSQPVSSLTSVSFCVK